MKPAAGAARPESTIRHAPCAHCHRALRLECIGLTGFWGYEAYNEYFCPQCRKQNHARTLGTVVSVRLA